MTRLVIEGGSVAGREFILDEGLNRIGRAPGNEIQVDEPSISAAHCELWLMKERLLVRDLGSTNGTFIDGRSVSEGELGEGVILGVGGVEFRVLNAPATVAIPKATEPPPPPPRFTPDGVPCCHTHWLVPAYFRCSKCGEQFCGECVRLLGRRGGSQHAYCTLCDGECVPIVPPRLAALKPEAAPSWFAKLSQTLRLRR